jgi:hypothetical protein
LRSNLVPNAIQVGPNLVPNSAQQDATTSKKPSNHGKKGIFAGAQKARRVRDSNPGARFRAYGFQDRRFRPLSQLSVCEKPLYDRVFLCSLAFGFEANLPHGGHSVALRISRRASFASRVDVGNRSLLHAGNEMAVDSEGHVSRRMPQDACGSKRIDTRRDQP